MCLLRKEIMSSNVDSNDVPMKYRIHVVALPPAAGALPIYSFFLFSIYYSF